MQPAPWWKGTRGEWYVAAQVVLFALTALAPLARWGLPAWPAPLAQAARLVGIAIALLGVALGGAGVLGLGRNLSPLPHPLEDAELVQTGPYGLVRHPIYSGILLGALGWALMTASSLALLMAAVLFIFFDFKTRREEKMLRARFAGYAAYARRVRKFIPFIY